MCTLQEIKDAVRVLKQSGTDEKAITLLHCNTEYPTPMEDVNLLAMLEIGRETGLKTGYSDHTQGIEVPVAAAALGATVIEKHFTLDRNMPGPDHKASLEPTELTEMIRSIRNIELALGDGHKKPSRSEQKNMVIARKSIHLLHGMNAGDILSEADLVMKRPGGGISPMRMREIVGKKLLNSLEADTMLEWEHLN
jgi:sialic acid synthase SpsE